MSRHNRRLRAAVLVALIAVPVLAARAQAAPARGGGTLEPAAQDAWVEPEGEFRLDVRVVGAPIGATIELSLRDQTPNRDSFRRGLEQEVFRLERFRIDAAPVSALAGDAGIVSFTIPVTADPVPPTADDAAPPLVPLPAAGVYPVVVTLRSVTGNELDTLVTHLIRIPPPGDEVPLAVALVLPLTSPPTVALDGSRELDTGSRLDAATVIDALDAHREVPLSLDITPDTIVAIESIEPDTFELLRGALAGRQVLARPLVEADATAWLEAGLTSEYAEQLSLGIATAADALGVQPTISTWLADPTVTPATISRLRGFGVTSLVMPESQLEPLDLGRFPLTLTQLFDVRDANDLTQVSAVADAELVDRIARTSDPVLAAHQLIADLSVLYFDQPGISRGAVIAPGDEWRPSEPFLNALLPALGTHPLIAPVTLDRFFTRVSFAVETGQQATLGFRLERTFQPEPAEDLSGFALTYTAAAGDVVSFEGLLPDEGEDAGDVGRELRELLLTSGSAGLDVAERQQYLGAIAERIAESTTQVAVTPPGRVSLASRSDDIPLLITNGLDHPINVVIGLTGDKLDFPDGNELPLTLEAGANQVSIPIRARTSGDSTLTLRVTSPDRAIELTSARVAIRSTAISGVGLVIAAVALAFLLVWWVRHHRRDRGKEAGPPDDAPLAATGSDR